MERREIYLAAGCFWGAQKYLDLLDGVLETCTGFANGFTDNPTYEDVYTDATGYAETVRVVYDADVLSLKQLVRLYFGSIDPFSVNKQGHDEGTRYRTGVYYSVEADRVLLEELFAELACEKAGEGILAVELEPLRSFFPASEYHQKYLEKNPGGYCHLPSSLYEAVSAGYGAKKRRYAELQSQLGALLEDETNLVARMAEVAAVLDIDSASLATFDSTDALCLERLVESVFCKD